MAKQTTSLRWDAEDLAAIDRGAAHYRVTRSEFIRRAALAAAKAVERPKAAR